MKKTRNTFQLRLEKEIERFYEGHKNYEIYAVRRAPENSPEPYFRAYVVMDKEIRYFVMSKFYQGKRTKVGTSIEHYPYETIEEKEAIISYLYAIMPFYSAPYMECFT